MKWWYEFSAVFIFVFFLVFTTFGVFGLLPSDLQNSINPDPIRLFSVATADADASSTPSDATTVLTGAASLGFGDTQSVAQLPPIVYTPAGIKEFPTRVIISSVGIDAPVLNPESISPNVLDQALLSGAVRYPLSGALNDTKDIFLFGHSTGFKVVHNQAYKTFSNLMNVKIGDEIRLQGEDTYSLYQVTKVSILTDSDAVVSIGGDGTHLTLSTCDTFLAKQDRVVVESKLIGNFKNSVVSYQS